MVMMMPNNRLFLLPHSLKTELRGSVARSWLRVSQAGRRDSGVYYCNVTNLAAASVTIHVVPGECVPPSPCLAILLPLTHARRKYE